VGKLNVAGLSARLGSVQLPASNSPVWPLPVKVHVATLAFTEHLLLGRLGVGNDRVCDPVSVKCPALVLLKVQLPLLEQLKRVVPDRLQLPPPPVQ
jgi:hypothetical protein